MTAQTDRYALARNPEHSTLGDALDRFVGHPDVFTAGAQYALDRMTGHIDRVLMDPHTSEYLIGVAADILTEVHEGKLI